MPRSTRWILLARGSGFRTRVPHDLGEPRTRRIEHNLALWTRSSSSLLDTDTTPASFWITRAANSFIGNHAAGSDRYGFWFDLQPHPTGPSADASVCPPGEGLGVGGFVDNTAHSNARYGLRVFSHWVPLEPGYACTWRSSWYQDQRASTARLENFTAYKNGRTGARGLSICAVLPMPAVPRAYGDARHHCCRHTPNKFCSLALAKKMVSVVSASEASTGVHVQA